MRWISSSFSSVSFASLLFSSSSLSSAYSRSRSFDSAKVDACLKTDSSGLRFNASLALFLAAGCACSEHHPLSSLEVSRSLRQRRLQRVLAIGQGADIGTEPGEHFLRGLRQRSRVPSLREPSASLGAPRLHASRAARCFESQ
jgi:hypothetical protein